MKQLGGTMSERRKMSNKERAKQFMPFSSLRGYGEFIKEKQRIKEERRELSESEGEVLSLKLAEIKRGQMIKVRYYNEDFYDDIEGIVAKVDFDFRNLTVVKTKIEFDDIVEIN